MSAPRGGAPGEREIAIAVIRDGPDLLVTRRGEDASFAGRDEFPGGHREPGESLESCLRREVREETGLEIVPQRLLAGKRVPGADGASWLWFFECRLREARPPSLTGTATDPRWVPVDALPTLRFPPANSRVVTLLGAADAS